MICKHQHSQIYLIQITSLGPSPLTPPPHHHHPYIQVPATHLLIKQLNLGCAIKYAVIYEKDITTMLPLYDEICSLSNYPTRQLSTSHVDCKQDRSRTSIPILIIFLSARFETSVKIVQSRPGLGRITLLSNVLHYHQA